MNKTITKEEAIESLLSFLNTPIMRRKLNEDMLECLDIVIGKNNAPNEADDNEFVDLGLPSGILWAKCNYGANKETESGKFYSYTDAMRLPIQLPTEADCKELIANTIVTWETINGVNGRKFTSKTDASKYIFIPASGCANNGGVHNRCSHGYVWASSLYSNNLNYAWYLYFGSNSIGVSNLYRCLGQSVRAVKSK